MSNLNGRILQIAKYYGLTKPADFAKKTGFSHQVASNYLKGARIPNGEALCIIKQAFDISADWLLTGDGEMLKSSVDEKSTSPAIIYKSDPKDIAIIADKQTIINRDAEILASNKDTIEIQKKLILSLEQRIKELEHSSPNSKTSGFHSVQSVDTSNPSQTGAKAKQPNK